MYDSYIMTHIHDIPSLRKTAVGVLVQSVELGNGVIEGGLGQVAGLLWGILDLVVENGVVKSQA